MRMTNIILCVFVHLLALVCYGCDKPFQGRNVQDIILKGVSFALHDNFTEQTISVTSGPQKGMIIRYLGIPESDIQPTLRNVQSQLKLSKGERVQRIESVTAWSYAEIESINVKRNSVVEGTLLATPESKAFFPQITVIILPSQCEKAASSLVTEWVIETNFRRIYLLLSISKDGEYIHVSNLQ